MKDTSGHGRGMFWLLRSEHHLVLSFKILCFYLVHGVITEDIVLEMKSAGLSLGYFFSFLSGKLRPIRARVD